MGYSSLILFVFPGKSLTVLGFGPNQDNTREFQTLKCGFLCNRQNGSESYIISDFANLFSFSTNKRLSLKIFCIAITLTAANLI
jgi:hypothetical protein